MHERDIARSLAGVAATVRVLVLGIPGEEPTATDLAEVSAFAIRQMRQAGFGDGRCLGASVWFTGGERRPGTVADVGAFLMVDPAEVAAGRAGMAQGALAGLLAEMCQRAEKSPEDHQAAIPEDERNRLTRELAGYLADLGRELDRQGAQRRARTTAGLCKYALDALRGWGAYTSIEGYWMKYVERLRPGTQQAFLAEAESALALLEYQPGRETDEDPDQWVGAPVVDRLMVEAKRLGAGLVCGVLAYLATSLLLDSSSAGSLPPLVVTLISSVALGLGVVLGYGVARRFFRRAPVKRPTTETPVPAALHGWRQVERRLTAWFSERFQARPISLAEECRTLAERFGIKETAP
jgi:hypothetical protein